MHSSAVDRTWRDWGARLGRELKGREMSELCGALLWRQLRAGSGLIMAGDMARSIQAQAGQAAVSWRSASSSLTAGPGKMP